MAATRSSSTLTEEIIDPWLLEEATYHGFLQREDIYSLLHANGDFVIRQTEITKNAADGSVRKTGKSGRQFIISVLHDPEGKCARGPVELDVKEKLVRNIIVCRPTTAGTKYSLGGYGRFDTWAQMLKHHQTNPVKIGVYSILLLRGVPRQKWEYVHKDVTVGKILGKGAFGEVFKGNLRKKTGKSVVVAVKSLKNESALTREKIDEMLKEARLMRGLNHPNVVRLHGVALCEQPMYIILEFVEGGSLDKYLQDHAEVIGRDEKLEMMMGACWGVTYIHDQGILHRDIASRNCLYDKDKTVKLSDFGLSRRCTVYKMKTCKKMPIKWMAPESINSFVFSTKTDIYSFGVLIYEMFSCEESFKGLNNIQARVNIADGVFNKFPESTPPALVKFIQEKMWAKDPAERLTMQSITLWMEKYTGMSLNLSEDQSDMGKTGSPAAGKKKSAKEM